MFKISHKDDSVIIIGILKRESDVLSSGIIAAATLEVVARAAILGKDNIIFNIGNPNKKFIFVIICV